LFCVARTLLSAKSPSNNNSQFKSKGEICAQASGCAFLFMRKNFGVSTNLNFAQRRPASGMAKYSKRKGEMAELIFVIKAVSMGFSVSKPFGDSDPYDLVAESHGRLMRIQVKSVFTTNRWGYSVTVARNRLHRRGEQYTAQEIDFLAAYVVVHDARYILPVAEIAGVDHIRLYPSGTKRRDGGRYEKYREAWDLLRLGATTSTESEEKDAGMRNRVSGALFFWG